MFIVFDSVIPRYQKTFKETVTFPSFHLHSSPAWTRALDRSIGCWEAKSKEQACLSDLAGLIL